MNSSRISLFVLGVMILYGCAASEPYTVKYDSSSDQSNFASNRNVMGFRSMSGGLSANQRIMWQAQAACTGESCTPDEVSLVFFNDTSKELNLDYRGLKIIIDGKEHSWQDSDRPVEQGFFRVPRGEFTRVSILPSVFAELASAEVVEVLFGETSTSVFNSIHSGRAEFRALAEAWDLK